MEVTAVVTRMSLDEAERCVTRIQEGMENIRALLLDLYEREGWKALGYHNWRDCVTAELRQSVATVYRQLRAAEIDRAVSQLDKKDGPLPTVQAQELGRLPNDDAVREVWAEVQEATNGRPTAATIREAVDRRLPTRRAPDPDIADDYVEDVNQDPEWTPPGYTPEAWAYEQATSEPTIAEIFAPDQPTDGDIREQLAAHDRAVIAARAWHAALVPAGYVTIDPDAVIATQTPLHVCQGVASLEQSIAYLNRLLDAARRVSDTPTLLEVVR